MKFISNVDFSPKERMLRAYKGQFSDRYAVAPEFWFYLPARLLKMDMVELEREHPHWKVLQDTFNYYGSEGWGSASPNIVNQNKETSVILKAVSETRYREEITTKYKGKKFFSTIIYDKNEPSWLEKLIAGSVNELQDVLDMEFSSDNEFEFDDMIKAHNTVGEDYLLEAYIGTSFFDFIALLMGFEKSALYFLQGDSRELKSIRERYIENQVKKIRAIAEYTNFESCFIGCAYASDSLIGPDLWKLWDKPYLEIITKEAHSLGLMVHHHFHGKCKVSLPELADLKMDCICPFERGPGGNIDSFEDLKLVRSTLENITTANGNVHTVNTLIRGNPEKVKNEVREIKNAFSNSPRLIIGTGDQVGTETPDENIFAMIEEGKRKSINK